MKLDLQPQGGGLHGRKGHAVQRVGPDAALRRSADRLPLARRPCRAPATTAARGTRHGRCRRTSRPRRPRRWRGLAKSYCTHSAVPLCVPPGHARDPVVVGARRAPGRRSGPRPCRPRSSARRCAAPAAAAAQGSRVRAGADHREGRDPQPGGAHRDERDRLDRLVGPHGAGLQDGRPGRSGPICQLGDLPGLGAELDRRGVSGVNGWAAERPGPLRDDREGRGRVRGVEHQAVVPRRRGEDLPLRPVVACRRSAATARRSSARSVSGP